jgi:hypothetical protein
MNHGEMVAYLDICNNSIDWLVDVDWGEVSLFQLAENDNVWSLIRRFDLDGCLLANRIFYDAFR